jgi:tetratricopeptide (TPR) repeat protein
MKLKTRPFTFGLVILVCTASATQAMTIKIETGKSFSNLQAQQAYHQREQDYIGYRRREEFLRQQREENEKIRLLALEFTKRRDYFGLGSLYYSNGYLRDAIEAYSKAIDTNPRNSTGYFLRARAKSYQNDLQGAITDYDTAIALNPESDGAYLNRAIAKYKLKDKNGSLQDFRSAARIHRAKGNTKELADTLDRIQYFFKVPE